MRTAPIIGATLFFILTILFLTQAVQTAMAAYPEAKKKYPFVPIHKE